MDPKLPQVESINVVGLVERERGMLYNSAVAIDRGRLVARYRKLHLLRGERRVFRPGKQATVFDVDGTTVGIDICYDLSFDESVARVADAGATVLVCQCSNMMPRAMAKAWRSRHNEIRARHAKEHGLWIVSSDIIGERDGGVSYGPTAVIDPNGTVVAQIPLSETGMIVAELASARRIRPTDR